MQVNKIFALLTVSLLFSIGYAPPDNLLVKKKLRKQIVQTAKTLIGKKYKYGGRGPGSFDCSGFTHFVYKQHALALIPVSREQAKQGKEVSLSQVGIADLLFFKKGKKIDHVALVSSVKGDEIRMIHSTSQGVIEESLNNSKYWTSRLSFARSMLK